MSLKKGIEGILRELQTKISVKYYVRGNVNYLKVPKEDYVQAARYLKEWGFRRLLTVSAVDRVEKGKFEVYFLVHNGDENVYIKVATEILRDKPEIPTLSELFPNAAMHEREAWELFGITFLGNNILQSLFLEQWVGFPPFRKDFNIREYVKRKYKLLQDEDL